MSKEIWKATKNRTRSRSKWDKVFKAFKKFEVIWSICQKMWKPTKKLIMTKFYVLRKVKPFLIIKICHRNNYSFVDAVKNLRTQQYEDQSVSFDHIEDTILESTENFKNQSINLINPFHASDLFWYPLKTSANLWFSDVFRGINRNQWHEMD